MKRSPSRSIVLLAGALCAAPVLAGGTFPSPEQPWTKREYVDFYFTHFNGNLALPHLRSADGRALIERLVDPGNVARIIEGRASLADKRLQIATILMAAGEIRSAYNYAVFVGEPLAEELTRVQSFTLSVVDAAAQLAQGEASASSVSAWSTTLSGVIHSLSERDIYSIEQRSRLTAAIAQHYPALHPLLSAADRRELQQRVSALAIEEEDMALRIAQLRLVSEFGKP
jgi:hypothetical protein